VATRTRQPSKSRSILRSSSILSEKVSIDPGSFSVGNVAFVARNERLKLTNCIDGRTEVVFAYVRARTQEDWRRYSSSQILGLHIDSAPVRRKVRVLQLHGHYQMDSDAVAVVSQAFYTHNFGQIFAIHWIICKCKWESDEQTHALVVVVPMSMKVNTAFRYVHADRKVCKVFVAWLRRTD